MLVDKVDLDLLDLAAPAVEAKDLVCERNALLGRDVPDLLPAGPAARRQVLGPELLLEARLERGDFGRCVLGDAELGFVEGVGEGRGMLIAWTVWRGREQVRLVGEESSAATSTSPCATRRPRGREGLTQAWWVVFSPKTRS